MDISTGRSTNYHISYTLLNFDEFILNYLDYGWEEKDSVIYPERCNQPIPNDFLKVCACKKDAREDVDARRLIPGQRFPECVRSSAVVNVMICDI